MKLLILHELNKNIPRALTDAHIEELQTQVPELEVFATEDSTKIAEHIKTADVVAGYPWQVSSITLADAPNLKWLHSFSAGVDRILTDEVKNSNLIVSNSSGIHATPIAEHIMGFLLVWTRGFLQAFRAQERHDWEKRDNVTELRGKTVFIVGLGAIGSETARLVKTFGAHVIASVRNERAEKPANVDELVVGEQWEDALPKADFVCICLPHSGETHHLFGSAQFNKMKKTAVITNIGRGGIIHEAELVAALKDGTIAGALLDVTETEPLPQESPLWDMSQVFITGHYSGFSEKYMDRAIERLILNLKAYTAGKPLPNAVNKTLGY